MNQRFQLSVLFGFCFLAFTSLIGAIMLSGCDVTVEKSNKDENPATQSESNQKSNPNQNPNLNQNPAAPIDISKQITLRFDPEEKIGFYTAVLQWPKVPGILRVLVGEQMIATTSSQLGEYKQRLIPGGSTVNYLIEQIDKEDRVISKAMLSQQVPMDLILSTDLNLTEDLSYRLNRLRINDGVQIVTFDHKLTLIAEDFATGTATIRNFSEGAIASAAQVHGRDGGKITLQFKKGEGKMFVFLGGENGKSSMCFDSTRGRGGNAGSLEIKLSEGALDLIPAMRPGTAGAHSIDDGWVVSESGGNPFAVKLNCPIRDTPATAAGQMGRICEMRGNATMPTCR